MRWLADGTDGEALVGDGLRGSGDGLLPGFSAGARVGGYRLEERVGAGGMAVVFRAVDERLGRRVALKVMSPAVAADDDFRLRFVRESRAAAAVDDPHIIPVYDAGEADGVLYIAMRYVPGSDARTLLRREGPLQADRALAIILPVAYALDAAHAAGLVHRDVKPANILVDARPDRPDHVYLSDFGLSKGVLSSVGLTGTGMFLGTLDYAAPEQIGGSVVDGRADQYSLACAAFELLTGSPPFPREQPTAVIWAHMSEPPPALSSHLADVPPVADDVLAKALAKAPEDRYPSCRRFTDALAEAMRVPPDRPRPGASLASSRPIGHPATEIARLAIQADAEDPSRVASPKPGQAAGRGGYAVRLLDDAGRIARDIDRTGAAEWSSPFSQDFASYRDLDRENALAFIAHGLAYADPGRAELVARSLRTQQPKALAAVADAVACADAANAARLLGDALRRLEQHAGGAGESARHRRRAEDEVARVLGEECHIALSGDLRTWANASRTFDDYRVFAEQCMLVVNQNTLARVTRAVAHGDPRAATRLLDDAASIALRLTQDAQNMLLIAIAEAAAHTDADYAEQLARAITTRTARAEALARIASAIAPVDAAGAAHIALDLVGTYPAPDRESRAWGARALAQISRIMEAQDAALAADLLQEAERAARSTRNNYVSIGTLAEIASIAAKTEPARAADLIRDAEKMARRLTDSGRHDEALAAVAVAAATAGTDPARAEQIARDMTDEGRRSDALSRVATATASANPVRARQIARAITIDDTRGRALAGLAMKIASINPALAADLLAEAEELADNLPPDANQEIRKNELLATIAEVTARTDPDRADKIAYNITHMDQRIRALVSIAVTWLKPEALTLTAPDSFRYHVE